VAFLRAVGALVVAAEPSRREAYALLELGDGASADDVKRAYRRLARALHPDAHPSANDDERRDLERRFAAVAAAYRRLSTLV
jgi:molecular chaperone DnaJ